MCGSTRPGRDRAAAGVEPGEPAERVALGLERRLDVGPRPDGDDPALPAGDDRRVRRVRAAGRPRVEDGRLALRSPAPEPAGERHDLGRADDQEARAARSSAAAARG